MTVVFLWIENAGPRLAKAQQLLEDSIISHGLTPLRYPAGRDLVLFGDVLCRARTNAEGKAFVWCNSDVILTKNPFDVPDVNRVYGFHRREIPEERFVYGVDMYYLPLAVWDNLLSKDIPDLYLGSSYVDWWISRKMQAVGNYENLTGYIDHPSHPKSSAANNDADPYYQNNFREFNRYAKRNGLDPIPAPPLLIPGVGHAWGLRDAFRKLLKRR
jgi:hypothetical protein